MLKKLILCKFEVFAGNGGPSSRRFPLSISRFPVSFGKKRRYIVNLMEFPIEKEFF